MYRCDLCKKVVPPNSNCKKIPITEMRTHPFRARVQKRLTIDKTGKKKPEWIDDPGGRGPQIIQEIKCCHDCYKQKNAI